MLLSIRSLVVACVAVCTITACGSSDPKADGQYRLMTAISRGDVSQVSQLLSSELQLDVNWQSRGVGPTPLSLAIQAHQLTIAELLISRGADPNIPGRHGYTALHSAAWDGDLPAVRLLVEANADVNAVDRSYGYTPLAYAVERGHKAVVDILLSSGADASVRVRDGLSILEIAKTKHRPDIVAALEHALN